MGKGRLFLLVVTSLVLVYGVLLASGTVPASSAEAQSARASLTMPVPAGKHDGFAEFWFAGRDVPVESMASLLEKDLQQIERAIAEHRSFRDLPLFARSETLPAIRPLDPEVSCTQGEMECVAKTRKLRILLAAELRQQNVARAAANRLLEADDLRAPGPELMAEMLTEWPGARFVLNDAALRFVDGETVEAQADLCRHVATWRRLRAGSRHLHITRLALPILADAAAIHAEMRAELPADAPLPEPCEAAFAPLTEEERSVCPIMAGELRLAEHMLNVDMRSAAHSGRDGFGGLAQDIVNLGTQPEPTLDLLALKLWRSGCTAPAISEPVSCSASERLFNPVGCNLVAGLPLRSPAIRPLLADLDRRLRLTVLARRWASYPDEASRAEAIRALMGEADPPPEQMGFDSEHQTLRVELLDPGTRSPWTIFLAGTWVPKPTPVR